MKNVFLFLGAAFLFLTAATSAHAIIFLPALILIPIAKIIALLIAGLSLPAVGVGALWSMLFHHSLKRTLFITLCIVCCVVLFSVLVLKLHNPARPWF